MVASRGLAGIDGCVSTASGIALADPAPTYALMGDLTFLHDANGLLVGPLERRPDLTVVVTNDDGGGIFTLLEPGEPERAADFERLFGTPTGTDLAALCAAHHVRHQRIASRDELVAALADQPSGLTVLEVPVDRGSHRPCMPSCASAPPPPCAPDLAGEARQLAVDDDGPGSTRARGHFDADPIGPAPRCHGSTSSRTGRRVSGGATRRSGVAAQRHTAGDQVLAQVVGDR